MRAGLFTLATLARRACLARPVRRGACSPGSSRWHASDLRPRLLKKDFLVNTFVYGIDFGTSNSSVTIWDVERRALVRDDRIAGVEASFLYFPYSTRNEPPVVGEQARLRYVQDRMRGRLFQAIKTILPNRTFTETIVNNTPMSLEELVALFLRHLKRRADAVTGQDVRRVVLGRPAVFSVDPEEDRLAESRVRRAAELAGFEEIHFQLEPIAAGFAYEARIHGPERVLVGDFGGGTSDFTLVQLDPARQGRTDRAGDILATAGLPTAGNKYDAATMWHKLTPLFGRNATYASWGKRLDVPTAMHRRICQWDQIVFLNTVENLDLLRRLVHASDDPEGFRRLVALIKENQGFALFQEIEAAKIALTGADDTRIVFAHPGIPIDVPLSVSEFDTYTEELTQSILGTLDRMLQQAQVDPGAIDAVFLTGGTSLIRSLRRRFEQRFSAHRLRGGDEFTSVADGLALSAPLFFPELH